MKLSKKFLNDYIFALISYEENDFKTFKVDTKRSDKGYNLTSVEISKLMGGKVLKNKENIKVDVHNPDFTLYVEVREENYVYAGKMMGHRGLPVGTAGKGMLLLSGGIDSPVAGYMMASRGMQLDAVYFHSFPYTSKRIFLLC